ncbi:MAG: Panacea domain-containing protein [Spirochaetia bacterium]
MTSVKFARYLTAYCRKKGIVPNITQTQKWTYLCYSFYIFFSEKELLFDDDLPYCWPYGPVFPELYYAQKDHPEFFQESDELYQISIPDDIAQLVELVINHFGNWSAGQLSTWSHREGTAWEKAYKKNPAVQLCTALDKDDIYEEFKEYIAWQE